MGLGKAKLKVAVINHLKRCACPTNDWLGKATRLQLNTYKASSAADLER